MSITLILLHGALLSNTYLEDHQINVIKAADNSPKQLCHVINQQAGTVIVAALGKSDPLLKKAASVCGSHINGLVYINTPEKIAISHHKIYNSIPKFYINNNDNPDKEIFEIAQYISGSVNAA